jgi:hypothetical protein
MWKYAVDVPLARFLPAAFAANLSEQVTRLNVSGDYIRHDSVVKGEAVKIPVDAAVQRLGDSSQLRMTRLNDTASIASD